MAEGFIKINRSLDDWEHGDSLAMIGFWVRLLLLASWEDKPRVKRGEIITTIPILAGICGCSEKTVRRYLEKLKASGEIKTATDHRKTKIKIVNWEKYQSGNFDQTADRTNDQTADQTADRGRLNNLYKRNKENKNKRIEEAQPPTLSEIKEFIEAEKLRTKPERFFEYYQERNWRGISDWKAKAREWDKTEVQRPQQKEIRKVPVPDYMEEKTVKPATEEEVPF